MWPLSFASVLSFNASPSTGVPVVLHQDHAYLLLVIVLLFIVNTWAAIKVGKARKLYDVPYPEMYAEKSNKNAKAFNCVQRAHQNVLENIPLFLVFLFTSAIFRPQFAAIFGLIRVLGFVAYVQGYASGDPTKRYRGAIGYIGLLGGLVLTIEAALKLLTVL
ncbi:hypothetical protein Poli38472_006484 [Pythium oligandrum]|uniref:Glutathione S-transferase 3, mitochondrial n=1 Tax=Pythium oligandrum TaxID=41045 RepID=A0A8K1FD40_PYTOL|nr:hypothetical protein Poli38472_006484 [Pythium oligandrum]|eukprot:TMW56474.1 hypothetical protein Poli38472_006484 [Pythium oligandrum]